MKKLYDNHGRLINYLRLAITDRCNLRCFYCMPQKGIQYIPKKELLNYEEMEYLVRLFVQIGISKLRITGGEPFLRRDIITFLKKLKKIPQLEEIHITTNGVATASFIPELKKIPITSINLSLDSLDETRFFEITRRNIFKQVINTFKQLLVSGIPIKINTVVIQGKNIEDIYSIAQLTKSHPISVRFIEEMPFNGKGKPYLHLSWNYQKILNHLKTYYPHIRKIPDPHYSTSTNYQVEGYKGTIGIIPGFSRTFCNSCNRIRLTAGGMLKTCLYDSGVLNIKTLLRSGISEKNLKMKIFEIVNKREKNGFYTEKKRISNFSAYQSMSSIGG